MNDLKLEDIPVNMGRYVLERMKTFGDTIAMVDGESEKTMTYRQLVERTERAAAGLQQFGMKAGDVICVISPNQMDYIVACYASALICATFQPMNPLQTTDDIRNALKRCNSKYIMTVPPLLDKVKDALAEGTNAIKVIVFGESEEYTTFESLLDPAFRSYTTPDCNPKKPVVALMSSSGTTGFPKAVRMSHYSVVANTIQERCAGLYSSDDCFITFVPFLHVYGLFVVSYFAHHIGAKVVIMSRFRPDEYLKLIQKHKPNTLQVVPPVMVMSSKYPKVADYDLSSVKRIICGAAPLSKEVEDVVKTKLNLQYLAVMMAESNKVINEDLIKAVRDERDALKLEVQALQQGMVRLQQDYSVAQQNALTYHQQLQTASDQVTSLQKEATNQSLKITHQKVTIDDFKAAINRMKMDRGEKRPIPDDARVICLTGAGKKPRKGYGTTEVLVTHINGTEDFKYKSGGKPLPLVEIKIVDVDTGNVLGPNKEGEIWLRGPQLCSGYLNLPEETANLFTEDGWVKTGDIGCEDEKGYLFVVDRLKELIKYKGFQVAPATLKDILLKHDDIADAGVVGMPDENAGELPRAYVVLKPGKAVTEENVIAYVDGLVTPRMKLRGGVKFVTEIPRTQSGKILRKTLKEEARQASSI